MNRNLTEAKDVRSAMSDLRIVVLGYIVRGPLGGLAWHHAQYVLGLTRLGHDVLFVEDSDDYPACYDPQTDSMSVDPTYGLSFIRNFFNKLGLGDRWAYHDAHAETWHGSAFTRVADFCRTADLVLNLSGVNPAREWWTEIPARALVDTDPVFTQIRHLTDDAERELAKRHTVFFSFGENIKTTSCKIPDDGFTWQATRQPIVLDAWAVTPGRADGKWTTVMQWDSYATREYGGHRFGMKSESFADYFDLARRTEETFELALGSAKAPREKLQNKGWHVCDPRLPTRDPWTYQNYLRGSKGEWGVAKHGYVVSRSGWFSERSAAYLASGRPVVTQETGFSEWLGVGSGVLSFSNLDEAVGGIEEVARRYDFHCRAAREIVAEYFDARKVLTHLLERAFVNSV